MGDGHAPNEPHEGVTEIVVLLRSERENLLQKFLATRAREEHHAVLHVRRDHLKPRSSVLRGRERNHREQRPLYLLLFSIIR